MLKLRVIALISLLIVAVAVGCSSSDQEAIDKAVSATLIVQQGAIETTVNSELESKGSHIVFSSKRDDNFEIYVMGDTGENQRRLTNNTSDDTHPDWSPDGTKIVFASDRNDLSDNLIKTREIYLMDIDGSNQVRLTNSTSDDTRPDWSPDGTKIVFSSNRDGNDEIYVMNADGSGQTRLTRNSVVHDWAPRWSPDGSMITFCSTRDGDVEIYTMNANGENQIRLTYSDGLDVFPDWSPDGSKIAFHSNRDGNHEIYVMNRDGTHQTRITSNDSSDNDPAWSPDGTRIVFTSTRDDTIEIYLMEADGSNQVRLTNAKADWPSWSPLRSQLESRTSNATATPVATVVRIQHEQTFVISNQVAERVRVTLNHNIPNGYDFSDFIILNANSEEDENLIVKSIFFRGDETNPAIVEIERLKPSSQSGEYTIRYFSVD